MPEPIPSTVWALTDDRPGTASQVLGVVQATGWPYIEKRLHYNALAALPNALFGKSFQRLDSASREQLQPPWPAVVISAGRRGAGIARAIKREFSQTFLVQLMWPGEDSARDFNIIATPEHDDLPPLPNVLRTIGAPHSITPTAIHEEAAIWKLRIGNLPAPYTSVLIGGDHKKGRFTHDDARSLLEHLRRMHAATGGSLLVTTSRRTPPSITGLLRTELPEPHYLHTWSADASNPYAAFLGIANRIVVTGDSISMCSEACITGAPVFIFTELTHLPEKHARFHQQLYDLGMAKPLADDLSGWHYPPLNMASEVARAVKECYAGRPL